MLKTEVNTLGKKGNPVYKDIKKEHGFIKIRITF